MRSGIGRWLSSPYLTKVPLCIFLFYLQQEKFWSGSILKLEHGSVLQLKEQTNGVPQRSRQVACPCARGKLTHLDSVILVGLLYHFHFWFLSPKSCVQVILCAIVEEKSTFLDWCWCKQPLFSLGCVFSTFFVLKLMPKKKKHYNL